MLRGEFQEKHIEGILRHALLEKEYFDENVINSIINDIKIYGKSEVFKRNPELLLHIDEIHKEALEKAKIRGANNEISSEGSRKAESRRWIQTIEEFEKKLQDLQKNKTDDWDFYWEVKSLFEENIVKDSKLDFIKMLDMSLELFEDENRRDDLIKDFWNCIPDEMRLEQIKDFVRVVGKYRDVDFDFAFETMSKLGEKDLEENPNFAEKVFGEQLSQGEISFLRKIKNKSDLKIAIEDAESRGATHRAINEMALSVIKRESKNGNLDSIDMLYNQLDIQPESFNRTYILSMFFIYANKTLIKENIENILRYTLIEKDYFSEQQIPDIVERIKINSGKNFLEDNPDLLLSIDEIQKQALQKTKELNSNNLNLTPPDKVVGEEVIVEESEKEEILALQEIRDSVPATEISAGTNMIKFFLSKAKEMKRKIGKFFGGGDDHDNR